MCLSGGDLTERSSLAIEFMLTVRLYCFVFQAPLFQSYGPLIKFCFAKFSYHGLCIGMIKTLKFSVTIFIKIGKALSVSTTPNH